MSLLAIILIVIGAITVIFLIAGFALARRRTDSPRWEERIMRADQQLEQARAADRGWDRELIQAAARTALGQHRPGFEPASLDLVLVDDRPGVEEDRAHLIAAGPDDTVRVVLARDASGRWGVERVE